MISNLLKLKKIGLGSNSIDTILTYNEYYMQWDYYRRCGASKMEAYTWAAFDCGIEEQTIMKAVSMMKKIIQININ